MQEMNCRSDVLKEAYYHLPCFKHGGKADERSVDVRIGRVSKPENGRFLCMNDCSIEAVLNAFKRRSVFLRIF